MDWIQKWMLRSQRPWDRAIFHLGKDSLVAFCSNASQIQWYFENILPSLICQWSTGEKREVSLIIY